MYMFFSSLIRTNLNGQNADYYSLRLFCENLTFLWVVNKMDFDLLKED